MINCKKCALFHHFRLNLFKKDKAHPRVYFITCGMSPVIGTVDDCKYYQKKKLKHRLGMSL
jgi:hypothetical protein